MNIVKRIVKSEGLLRQILIYAPGSIVPALFGLLSASIFTRIFNPVDYGLYSLVLSVAVLLSALISQWLQQAIARFLPGVNSIDTRKELKNGLVLSIFLMALGTVVLAAVAAPFFYMIRSLDLWRPFFIITALFIFTSFVFNILNAVFQAEFRAKENTKYNLLSSLLRFCLSLLLILCFSKDVTHLMTGFALAGLILLSGMWKKAISPTVSWNSFFADLRGSVKTMKMYFRYGFPLSFWYLATVVLSTGDRYILQLFRGTAEVGIYSANYGLIHGAIGFVSAPLINAAHPFLMKAWNDENYPMAAKWLNALINWFAIVSILLVGFIVLFSKDIVFSCLGEKFRKGYIILPVIIVANSFFQLGIFAHKPLEFKKKTNIMLYVILICVGANILLNFLLIPSYGYLGAALAACGSHFLYFLLVSYEGNKILKWEINYYAILLNCLAVAALIGVIKVVRLYTGSSIILLIMHVLLFSACGALILLVDYKLLRKYEMGKLLLKANRS